MNQNHTVVIFRYILFSSSSDSSSPIESNSEPENHRDPPVWTRQRGQAPPPQADTDTLPSSEEEEDDYTPSNPPEPPSNRIFVKDSNGAFVGVTPNQLHHLKYSERQQSRLHSSPQETRRKRVGH